ncbi:unnamed protein product [Prunus armeniaca]
MRSNVELIWPESEAYSSRVNNCSHANSSLAAIRVKLSAEQLEEFKTSYFGHLLNIDKIQFSGQIVHGVVLRRVVGQGVKDLDGLSFLIGCDVAQFTRQDFCLIIGLCFGEVPKVSSGESVNWNAWSVDDYQFFPMVGFWKRYFIDEGITCNALEEAFLRCTEEDDIYKLALVYFAELVVLGRDKHLNINLNYLTLVEDLDAFNSFENEEGRGKGKSKVTGTSRRNEKGKKDKHGEVQRGGWSFKGFTYAFQIWVYELIPRMVDLNYCKVVDPTALLQSIPFSCADLDELNKVVSLLRSEFQVKREKDVLELKVIRMEKLLDHCLGPQFEQEVRKDLALLKKRTNRCAISHLFNGSEEMDDIRWDEGPSNKFEGEEKEEEEGIEGGEAQRKRSEVEEAQRKRSEGEQVKIESIKGEEAQRKSSEGEEVKRKSSEGEDSQRKKREGKEVKRQRSEEKEEDDEFMLLGSKNPTLDQPIAMLS